MRNKIITRDEAVNLVKKYDGEFPSKYFKEILEYLQITNEEFEEMIYRFRSPLLWEKINSK